MVGLETAKERDNVVALHPKALDRYKSAVLELADELKRGSAAEFATIRELVSAIIVHASPSRPGGAGTKANAEDDRSVRLEQPSAVIQRCFPTWLCRGIVRSRRGTRTPDPRIIMPVLNRHRASGLTKPPFSPAK